MLNRQSGSSSSSSAIVGTGCSPAIRAARTSSAVSRASSPCGVGDPVERLVVEGEQHAVTGGVDVGLEVAVAERDGVPEGVQRVLDAGDLRVQGAAAVGHRDHRARLVEHGVEVGEPGHGRGTPGRHGLRGHASSIHRHAAMVLPNRRPGPSAFLLRWLARRGSTVRDMDEMTCPKCGGTMAARPHGRVTRPAVRVLPGRLPRPCRPRVAGRGENDWHAHRSTDTAQLPRITPDMVAPPARAKARSYVDSLFSRLTPQRSRNVSIWAPSSLSRSARSS